MYLVLIYFNKNLFEITHLWHSIIMHVVSYSLHVIFKLRIGIITFIIVIFFISMINIVNENIVYLIKTLKIILSIICND